MLINQISNNKFIVSKPKSSDANSNTASGINVNSEFQEKLESYIPEWVDEDYFFDPKNPRKPHLSELMEHISGKSIHELYEDTRSAWKDLYLQCVDL